MDMQRRQVLATVATVMPAMAIAPRVAHAWTGISSQDVGITVATGIWAVLEHVTDNTNPSTSIIAPPQFTQEIRKLAGTEIALTGYLQPVTGGFGKKQDYLLSLNTFHCPYCYPSGRGTLALTTIEGHVPQTGNKVTVKGTLVLQETDPSDFYFQLKNAKIA